MKTYDLLNQHEKRLYMYIEDIVSDYKVGDITLEETVNEILIKIFDYEKEKEGPYIRGED